MSNTSGFFENKKPWSKLKDTTLDYYLVPYIPKILATKRPLTMIDCFAGKGKYDDGNEGSPIIIAKQIKNALIKNSAATIKIVCIEKKYHDDLTTNTQDFKDIFTIIDGTFEENIATILKVPANHNVFLYIDPYGVKSLDFNNFKKLQERGFNSFELLMNFNAFGFLREGCRLLKYDCLFEDDEADTDYEEDVTDSIEKWDKIAGGTYWQDILNKKKENKINMHEAEEQFVSEYLRHLKSIFKHVVNVPIKTKEKNIPKYRLVFGTNHQDGLILMADNMHRTLNKMLENARNHQLPLIELPPVDNDLVQDEIKFLVPDNGKILMKDVVVRLIEKYGVVFSEAEYKQKVKALFGKTIQAEWHPPTTAKTGKPARSLDYNKYTIYLKKVAT